MKPSPAIGKLTESNEKKLEPLRETVEVPGSRPCRTTTPPSSTRCGPTVDEKLQATLEKRLGESFKLVSERLEQVHKGLGEMQTLAAGVGDLKKVLTNVKTRGTWGEVQLGALLEQVLTPDQYDRQRRHQGRHASAVEFAIRLPGRGRGRATRSSGSPSTPNSRRRITSGWSTPRNAATPAADGAAARQLEVRIKAVAKDIRDKYLDPPHTTDFAIMFLPTEGLYAEVIRRPGLFEALQRDCRVVVAGPTTLAALLNSLQMGFRTLAIEKRSSEVWKLLGAVKTEFGKFGECSTRYRRSSRRPATHRRCGRNPAPSRAS